MTITSGLEDQLLPAAFRDEAHLEEFLSTPTRGLAEDFAKLDGDIMVLGVAGKVGPTLAMMAKRAAEEATAFQAASELLMAISGELSAVIQTLPSEVIMPGAIFWLAMKGIFR